MGQQRKGYIVTNGHGDTEQTLTAPASTTELFVGSTNCICATYPCSCGTYFWPWQGTVSTYTPYKAVLSIEDIRYLSKLAKKDARLRGILQQLSSHIEVDVSF